MDASIRTYILEGPRAEEFAAALMAKSATNLPVLKVQNLAPAHVNCVRVYIAAPQEMADALRTVLDGAGEATFDVKVLHDDYLKYGQP
jgi:hypothetical protein